MQYIIDWSNQNSGFLSLILFVVTLFIGWFSGIFRSLRKRPKLKISIIEGPSLVSTFESGGRHDGQDTHITAASLYLQIINQGSADTSFQSIHLGYHNFSLRYTYLWFWLKNRTVALSDFTTRIDEDNIKVYPFLEQQSALLPTPDKTFLRVGESTNGIIYFEQEESFGGFKPRIDNLHKVKIKIRIIDSFGGKHTYTSKIPFLEDTAMFS